MRVILALLLAGLLVSSAGAAGARNGRIAYISTRNGVDGIWVMNADGSGQHQILQPKDSLPTWSPDGKRIAFERPGTPADAWVANADGTGAIDVTHLTTSTPYSGAGFPTWSPDGTRIAYDHTEPATDSQGRTISSFTLETVAADGTCGAHALTATTTDKPFNFLRWSPDGKHFAFSRGDIWVMNADGTGERDLTNTPRSIDWEIKPEWSPDSKRLVYTFRNASIYVINADGSGKKRLAFGWGASWSPDGKRIVYSSRPGSIYTHGSYIYVMDANGTNRHRLTSADDLYPSWARVP